MPPIAIVKSRGCGMSSARRNASSAKIRLRQLRVKIWSLLALRQESLEGAHATTFDSVFDSSDLSSNQTTNYNYSYQYGTYWYSTVAIHRSGKDH